MWAQSSLTSRTWWSSILEHPGNGYIERDLAIELRNLVAGELRLLGVPYEIDADKNALAATMQWRKGKFTAKDILVDIHWNAAANPDCKRK
jgi:hypothetical protein